jgi:hypothetical protein
MVILIPVHIEHTRRPLLHNGLLNSAFVSFAKENRHPLVYIKEYNRFLSSFGLLVVTKRRKIRKTIT